MSMSTNMFHEPQNPISFLPINYTPHEFGLQFMSGIKFIICALIFWKVFELTFLKFRKRLTIEDRIQKKYRYCHGELIEHYSEDENKLMYTTISNTIKNTEIKKKEPKGKGRREGKKVSFNIEKNNYYNLEMKQMNKDEQIEPMPSSGEEKEDMIARSTEKEEKKEVLVTVVEGEKKEDGFEETEIEISQSKITQETQTSSLLETSNIKECMKKVPEPPIRPQWKRK